LTVEENKGIPAKLQIYDDVSMNTKKKRRKSAN
jgi:hypothetical protein